MKHAELILRLGHQPMVQRLPIFYPALYAQYDTWQRVVQLAQAPQAVPHLVLFIQELKALIEVLPVTCRGVRVN
ncbi:MAG: hypothetical protein ACKOX6_00765 [Bdellovibrio sp.]